MDIDELTLCQWALIVCLACVAVICTSAVDSRFIQRHQTRPPFHWRLRRR